VEKAAGEGAAGAEAKSQEGAGGESLLSQALAAGKGAGDKDEAGKDVKPGDAKDAAKDGEPEKKDDAEKGTKPLTSADFAGAIPEGKVWDEELGKSFLDIVNEANISPEAAKKMLTLYSEQQDKIVAAEQAAEAAISEMLAKEEAEWAKAAKADKEYGGQKWEAAQAVIARGSQKLATPEAVALFKGQRLGNHPEVLRMFYRAGLLTGEDGGLNAGGAGVAKQRIEDAIFGESVKNLKRVED
jgi:hypothetical protein